ncbi:MAG: hypothetical protein A3F33_02820 [Candidatus Woykebacteria bacterium RIFCSPHIGHO2_12_FULL_43_10]|uniref:Endolytic murein transglycosylase n=2 Tax=Candidatus Woykeibacteriota TaxID=1817899 RepID=A0A1G1WXY6_9BACT|nr:MAG: hypothetical protein A2802_01445 [Candidatus Woykebacteria bacterium RIFCSPHIGHO2_01_FULL_43_29]OGY28681.1 MAG: hypothetical protein A3J50_01025 [Candidatus Woykebacteria bacterium RIFCSPHIGHO2_02_FULL_43_16b]OGY29757.1 MAG: hypothetical protein A3F33_02820 [Candidatus Woykebacteria bacterium RIFCSPHIGHO2_12_FULL_43_10]OGY32431.1 MAG: hypothetical protein A3A61_00550 [Candidatus Woykebacteria bacterium RIFCSPLOWO2_01_FULL_43_14]
MNKIRYNLVRKKLLLSCVVLIAGLVLAVNALWSYFLSPTSNKAERSVFVISQGESLSSIAQRLEKNGFIRNSLVFKLYLRLHNQEKNIQSGDFKLIRSFSMEELVGELTHGVLDKWVRIVEGLRKEEIAIILEKELGISQKDFLSLAQEGYMFPDTYLLPVDASALDIVDILKDNFDAKFDSQLENQIPQSGLTKDQIVTLASIVEREARDNEQREIIAGILLKRLAEGMPLETDATVQYALGYDAKNNTWWRKNITREDLESDSPYNTRKFAGLPPGPICNPGLSAIKAVLNPKSTPYWFYAHDDQGKAYYGVTLEEHNQNVANYLR